MLLDRFQNYECIVQISTLVRLLGSRFIKLLKKVLQRTQEITRWIELNYILGCSNLMQALTFASTDNLICNSNLRQSNCSNACQTIEMQVILGLGQRIFIDYSNYHFVLFYDTFNFIFYLTVCSSAIYSLRVWYWCILYSIIISTALLLTVRGEQLAGRLGIKLLFDTGTFTTRSSRCVLQKVR